MKRLLLILILTFSFHSLTKADDIRDFEIEGMSIGDTIKQHISDKIFLERKKYEYKYKHTFAVIGFIDTKYKIYEKIRFTYKPEDKKRTIYGIDGVIYFDDALNKCLDLQKDIAADIKLSLKDYKLNEDIYDHWADTTKQSKVHQIAYDLSSGDSLVITCFDWSKNLTKEKGWRDNLKVSILTKELAEFFISLN